MTGGSEMIPNKTSSKWARGDWVVYRKCKRSCRPGPRAANIHASAKGESYTYLVDKFWVVEGLLPEEQILLRTATGKSHILSCSDPSLRRPSLMQRMFFRNRFHAAAKNLAVDHGAKLAAG